MAATLEITGLTLRFGGITALDHVGLALGSGGVLGLAGPNGSGKSSLINVLTGHHRAEGTVRLDGVRIDALSPAQRARRGIIRTFQTPRVYRRMTLLENLHAACHAQRPLLRSRAAQRRDTDRAMTSLAQFGLAHMAQATPDRLTLGELRLLELARAHVTDANLLLLDEPAAGASADEARRLSEVMAQHLIPGRTVILVEHRIALLRALCTQLVVLEAGHVLAHGTCDAVLSAPNVRHRLMGETGDA